MTKNKDVVKTLKKRKDKLLKSSKNNKDRNYLAKRLQERTHLMKMYKKQAEYKQNKIINIIQVLAAKYDDESKLKLIRNILNL
jgi:hypothetical protein